MRLVPSSWPRLGLLCLLALSSIAPRLAADDAPVVTVIPVVVNVYHNSGATEETAKKAVAEASKVFADNKANVKFVVVKVHVLTEAKSKDPGGDDGTGGDGVEGTAADGILTAGERIKAVKYGQKEIDALPGKKGVKVSFTKTPIAEFPLTPGAANFLGVVFLQHQGAKEAEIKKAGESLAHELAHVLGLRGGHKIREGVEADAQGHADPDVNELWGKKNLMAAGRHRTGTHLTDDQKKVIHDNAGKWGWCTKQFEREFPGVKLSQGFGREGGGVLVAAGAGPVPAGYDIQEVVMTSVAPPGLISLATIDVELRVASASGPAELGARWNLGFDVDNNDGTGIAYGGALGIDRRVEITSLGALASGYGDPVSAEHVKWLPAMVWDAVTGELMYALPSATSSPVYEFSEEGTPISSGALLHLALPPEALGAGGPQVDVVVVAEGALGSWSTAEFEYHFDAAAGRPEVRTHGTGTPTPGGQYPVDVSGLTPLTFFTLRLADEVVALGFTDATGAWSGSFTFPTGWALDQPYPLTAQDDLGALATGMTCPEWPDPEPSAAGGSVGGL